jgi:RHS repeat-associated protein
MSRKLVQRFNFLVNLVLVTTLLISSFTVNSKPAIAQPPGPTASAFDQSPLAPAATSAGAVRLTDTGFSPQVITVTAGATVTWTNETAKVHLVKSGRPGDIGTNHLIYLPAVKRPAAGFNASESGAASEASPPLNYGVSWSATAQDNFSATINPGGTFSHTFATPGETPYYSATSPQLTGKVIVLEAPLPPDPTTIAPPLAPGVASNISSSTTFLYTGSNPIQTGVQSGTIHLDQVAALRGKVIHTDGSPLVGVSVTVKDHPEFGKTYSRADGMYDLAINGGEVYTLQYTRSGFLPVQRKLEPNWREFEQMPDVALTNFDARVTTIDLSSTGMQVAQGSPVSDADGSRQGTLLIPPGTQAELVFANGSKQAISTFHVRVSEYTAGENGSKAMPGELPAESGYTYAVEYSLDEALQAGAVNVNFSQALIHYTQNFLHFKVGEAVPTGYYDRLLARWVPGDNGRVVKIISIAGGLANLDTDGDGTADNGSTAKDPLVISSAERQRLAQVFQAGQELWRVPVQHFTPWDCNWPYGPPPDAKPPKEPSKNPDPQPKDEDKQCGSIIGCQSQNLMEKLPIAGTPFELVYSSQRSQPNPNTLKVQLTEATYPSSLASILLVVDVANNRYEQTFSPSANLITTFTWDGKDAYGRTLQGAQPITVKIGYVYPAYYYSPGAFGRAFARSGGNLSANRTRMEMTMWQTSYQGTIGNLDARIQGLGGWTLSSNHIYATVGRNLYLGSGEMRSAEAQDFNIINTLYRETVSGEEPYFNSLAMGPDGSVYALDMWKNRLDKITPDGQMTVVAGKGTQGYSGDGGPAVNAEMKWPVGVAVGPDGSIFIADGLNHVVRRVSPNGIISTFAGNGGNDATCKTEDGTPAIQHCLGQTGAVAVAPNGTVYFSASQSIYRVAPDGLIYEIAGHNSQVGEGIPAYDAALDFVTDMTLGPDGTIYLVDGKVQKITPAGLIYSVAGHNDNDFAGDGGTAVDAHLRGPNGLSLGPDGSLYIADSGNNRVRRVRPDGIIETVAGGDWVTDRCDDTDCPDGSLATLYTLSHPLDVLVGPDGAVYIADHFHSAIRKVVSALPGYSAGDALIASEDGSQVYRINSSGQHSQTLDALTGAVLYTFTYDVHGALASITDAYGSKTVIERDGSGRPTGILSPYGQRTTLALDSFGFLKSFTNPLGAAYTFTYTSGGLLTSLKEPLGGLHTFSYDTKGRLLSDVDPLGTATTLARIDDANGYAVTVKVGGADTTTYSVHKQPNGDILSEETDGAGLKTTTLRKLSGSETITYPNGTVETLAFAPDPRWGTNAAYLKHYTCTTPAGLTLDIVYSRQAALGTSTDPFDLTTLTDTMLVNNEATTTTIYTGSDRTSRTTSPNGWVTSLTVDALGRTVAWQAPGLEAKHYSYDAHGRLASISQGSGAGAKTTKFAFTNTSTGTILHTTDPLGNVTIYTYDLADQLTSMTEPGGAVTGYAYDANGNTLSVTPPGKAAHTFTYNAANQVTAYLPPGTGAQATTYAYTSDKQLSSVTYPGSPALSLGYDTAGRLAALTTARGTETFTYDPAKGFISAISAPGGISQSFTYDGSLLTGATSSGPVAGSLAYTYDNNFRLTSLVYPGDLTESYAYNYDDQLTQAGDIYLYYNGTSPLLSELHLNNIQAQFTYDAFGGLSQVVESYQGTEIYSVSYGFDKDWRITSLTETIEGVTASFAFTYDPRGRLLTVTKNGSPYASYSYDANGNRLTSTGPGGNASGVYDAEDRMTQYGAASFTYTPDGRLRTRTSGGKTTTYTYDTLDNLTAVTLPDGKQITYLVDGLGRRIGKKVQGSLVAGYLYDQGRLVAALDGSGNVVSRFIYASRDDVPDEMERGGVLYRIVTDLAGSVRLVINTSDGSIAQRIDYDPFGQILSDSNPGFQPFGFAGGLYDTDTKLVRFGARDYDPLAGRWTAKDPILFDGNQSNLYVYVNNDPLTRRDPSGLLMRRDPGGYSLGCGGTEEEFKAIVSARKSAWDRFWDWFFWD